MDKKCKRVPISYSEQKLSNFTLSASLANITNKSHANLNQINEAKKNLFKTPSKITPLKLNSAKKPITPHTNLLLNDRYIPNRITANLEMSYHLIHSSAANNGTNATANNGTEQQESSDELGNVENQIDMIKRKLIADTCNGVTDRSKILSLHTKLQEVSDIPVIETMKAAYSATNFFNTGLVKAATRSIPTSPERILDAPEIRNDYYLNLIDWSAANLLAVALNKDVYIWDAETSEISSLFYMDEEQSEYIASVSWIQGRRGEILAVGNSKNVVELWDVNTKTCMRRMCSHTSRVASLAWNEHMLASGSRNGHIHMHDVRVAQHHVGTLKLHDAEVCGLKWSPDGKFLASGANDNLAVVWDAHIMTSGDESRPLYVFRQHQSAVKALAWCPWHSNVLASGGGTADRKINIWNIYNGNLILSQEANSQISALLWSRHYKELISSHGVHMNQLTIWKYPEMNKVCDLTGHTNRVLGMCMSPDEETVLSISADETLRLWRCFAVDQRFKRKDALGDKKSSQHSLNQFIR